MDSFEPISPELALVDSETRAWAIAHLPEPGFAFAVRRAPEPAVAAVAAPASPWRLAVASLVYGAVGLAHVLFWGVVLAALAVLSISLVMLF